VHGLTALELYGYLPSFLGQSVDDFWRSEFEGLYPFIVWKIKGDILMKAILLNGSSEAMPTGEQIRTVLSDELRRAAGR